MPQVEGASSKGSGDGHVRVREREDERADDVTARLAILIEDHDDLPGHLAEGRAEGCPGCERCGRPDDVRCIGEVRRRERSGGHHEDGGVTRGLPAGRGKGGADDCRDAGQHDDACTRLVRLGVPHRHGVRRAVAAAPGIHDVRWEGGLQREGEVPVDDLPAGRLDASLEGVRSGPVAVGASTGTLLGKSHDLRGGGLDVHW